MNFLAHIYLSGKTEKIIIGNFIGDFVKGNKLEKYDPEIRQGIQLHREIDRYTDDHPTVLRSKKLLWEKYHHYSPVIIDVFYDHFLASNWLQYHEQPLINFTEETYQMLDSNQDKLPERVKKVLIFMRQDNWLLNYQSVDGIRKALTGMSKRTKFVSKLDQAHEDLNKYYMDFHQDFESFFPELTQHSKDFLSSLNQ